MKYILLKLNNKRYSIFRLFFIVNLFYILLNTSIYSFEILESPDTVEDLNLKILKVLNNLTDDRIEPVAKTRGFNYRYAPLWYSPFKYDIYIGKFSRKSQGSLLRIEATRKGEEKVLKNIIVSSLNLPKEGEMEKEKIEINKKSHIISQMSNILSPTLNIIYVGSNSPLYQRGEMFSKIGIYLLIDFVIISTFAIYAENTTRTKSVNDRIFLQEGPNRLDLFRGEYSGFLLTFLAIPRLVRAFDAFNEVSSQNKYHDFFNQKTNFELSYSLKF